MVEEACYLRLRPGAVWPQRRKGCLMRHGILVTGPGGGSRPGVRNVSSQSQPVASSELFLLETRALTAEGAAGAEVSPRGTPAWREGGEPGGGESCEGCLVGGVRPWDYSAPWRGGRGKPGPQLASRPLMAEPQCSLPGRTHDRGASCLVGVL